MMLSKLIVKKKAQFTVSSKFKRTAQQFITLLLVCIGYSVVRPLSSAESLLIQMKIFSICI